MVVVVSCGSLTVPRRFLCNGFAILLTDALSDLQHFFNRQKISLAAIRIGVLEPLRDQNRDFIEFEIGVGHRIAGPFKLRTLCEESQEETLVVLTRASGGFFTIALGDLHHDEDVVTVVFGDDHVSECHSSCRVVADFSPEVARLTGAILACAILASNSPELGSSDWPEGVQVSLSLLNELIQMINNGLGNVWSRLRRFGRDATRTRMSPCPECQTTPSATRR